MEFDFEAKDKDGHTYYRQDGQWFQAPIYFVGEKFPIGFDKVPDDVKQQLQIEEDKRVSELMMSGPLSNESTSSDRYANESVNDVNMEEDDDEIKPKMKKDVMKKESTSTSAGQILSRSRSKPPAKKHHQINKTTPPTEKKFDPRKSALAPMSGKKLKDTPKPGHSMDGKEKKQKLPYALITDSQQLIRPIRAELKVKEPEMAKQLLARMQIRKRANIFDSDEEAEANKFIPFEPTKSSKKQDLKYLDEHDKNRQKAHNAGMEFVVKLARYKYERKLLKNAKNSEEELIPASSVKHLRLKPEVCFKIEDLEQFAKARGLVVLNLDKFILSTDQRVPIYNSNGNCNFCLMHQIKTNGPHSDELECPYKFCNCTSCYVAGKFGNRLEEFFSLGEDEDTGSNSAGNNNNEDGNNDNDDDELPSI